MDTKTEDCEPVNPLFTSKTLQTLCETPSGSFAVQGTPDFDKSAFRLITRQGGTFLRKKEKPRPPIYCAKTGCFLVPLGRSGLVAKVDPESVPLISKYPWHKHSNATNATIYAATRLDRCFQTMHRLLCGLKPHGAGLVDHINGDGLDNRLCNLRIANHAENARNRRPKFGRQFVGIHAPQRRKNFPTPWVAVIGSERQLLGFYKTPEEAARAFDAAAIQRYGNFARLNFPLTPTAT